jgi:tetratricopeptide (TPR) repeat protein
MLSIQFAPTDETIATEPMTDLERSSNSAHSIHNDVRGIIGGNVTQIGVLNLPSNYSQPWIMPRQLPADIVSFTNRHDLLGQLDHLANQADVRTSVPIALLVGTAGVGKTAMALHWGHRAAKNFPDGSLYINLRGHDPSNAPLTAAEALTQFIHAVGLKGTHVPRRLEERAALFRTLTTDKRLLVVLDNAASAEHVRPLVPGSSSSLVVVTSRNILPGLVVRDGAKRLYVPVLSPEDSATLLGQLVGDRAAAEPQAVEELVEKCARLPLALRVAAELVVRSEFLSISEMLAGLETERAALESLSDPSIDGSTDVKSVFSWSYRSLSPSAERAFRLIGLHPGGSITLPATAAILGVDIASAVRLIQELLDAQLIKETTKGRFRYHDLLRAYAIDRAQADESQESRQEAFARILTWYLYSADAANRVLAPSRRHVTLPPLPADVTPLEFDSYDTALAWCEAQRLNLIAATEAAESNGFLKIAWMLPSSLFSFFYVRWYLDDWITTYSVGSRAAERLGDLSGQSMMLHRLGVAYKEQGLFSDALPRFEAALAIRREIGDRQGEATALSNMGLCATGMNNAQQALLLYHDSLEISIEVSDAWTEGWTLHNLGEAESALGLHAAARDSELASLRIGEQIGDRIVQALALEQLGEVYHALAEYSDAMACHQRSLNISRDLGHRAIEARVLRNMGCSLADQNSLAESLTFFTESIGLSEVAGDRLAAARTVMALADVLCRQDNYERRLEAKALFLRAITIFTDMGAQEDAERARLLLAGLSIDSQED